MTPGRYSKESLNRNCFGKKLTEKQGFPIKATQSWMGPGEQRADFAQG